MNLIQMYYSLRVKVVVFSIVVLLKDVLYYSREVELMDFVRRFYEE